MTLEFSVEGQESILRTNFSTFSVRKCGDGQYRASIHGTVYSLQEGSISWHEWTCDSVLSRTAGSREEAVSDLFDMVADASQDPKKKFYLVTMGVERQLGSIKLVPNSGLK